MSDDISDENNGETNGGEGGKSGAGSPSWLNRYYKVLANPRRRCMLYYLDKHRGESITLDELAKQVKAMETEYSPDTLTTDECTDVRRELYHNHLPRLADYGIIDFDPRSEDVGFHNPSQIFLILLQVSHLIERTL